MAPGDGAGIASLLLLAAALGGVTCWLAGCVGALAKAVPWPRRILELGYDRAALACNERAGVAAAAAGCGRDTGVLYRLLWRDRGSAVAVGSAVAATRAALAAVGAMSLLRTGRAAELGLARVASCERWLVTELGVCERRGMLGLAATGTGAAGSTSLDLARLDLVLLANLWPCTTEELALGKLRALAMEPTLCRVRPRC